MMNIKVTNKNVNTVVLSSAKENNGINGIVEKNYGINGIVEKK